MQKRMLSAMGLVFGLALLATAPMVSARTPDAVDAPATFARLKELVGEWQGTWEPGSVPTTVTYSLTGDGSVLVEDYRVGETTMATLYHLDGDRLMLTHYCSAGNQPRMRATSAGADGTIVFDFLDVTNHQSGGYSKALTVRLIDDERIYLGYTGSRTGRTSGVELERVR